MKFIWKNIGTRVWLITTSIIVVLVLAVSIIGTSLPIASNSLDLVFGGERAVTDGEGAVSYEREYDTKAEALAAAEQFVIEAESEGMVLLKNNNSLPLSSSSLNVSVFGKNSVDLVYTGSGSASGSSTTDLYQSLTEAGISYNPTLKSFYDSSASGSGRPSNPSMESGQRLYGFATGETPLSSYTESVKSSYSSYHDAAIVVISRIGGEGFDLPRTMATDNTYSTAVDGAESVDSHYLELDANEKALLEHVKANFTNVIVVLNCGTTMEMGDLQNDDGIDGILWIGFPGSTGIMALGKLLIGEITPSGHTTDTWVADFTQDPSWYNTGVYGSEYGNRYLYNGSTSDYAFVNYEEGIYVGYRYWETRGYTELQADSASTWYDDNVVYPFGYGLSYTTFSWEVSYAKTSGSSISASDSISVSVKVTNIGSVAGKDVVQLYYSAPYYDGGIEKAYVVLGDFAKTDTLAAGESQTLKLTINVEDMKSYDYNDANNNSFCGYELDAGDYSIAVAGNSHDAATAIMVGDSNTATYTLGSNSTVDADTVENRFDDVSYGIGIYDVVYLSRSDFSGTIRTGYLSDEERTLTDELKDELDLSCKRKYTAFKTDSSSDPWYVSDETVTVTPVNNGISLADLLYDEDGNYVGKVDYDDSRWDDLLDEISLDEMKTLIGYGAFRTCAVAGVDNIVNKPLTNDGDSPTGWTSFLSESVFYDTCTYNGECVLGATWNTEITYRMGQLIGEEGLAGNEKGDGLPYSGWYAPAVNIHRSPFGGRNWEYYSEDGLLSGKLAATCIQGAAEKGVYCYVKHFCINDQETDREYNGILVWANEQSMRELYFTPFELAVKEGGATAMMSSFNRIGKTWTGGSYALCTEVLRNEWGFHGMIITDYTLNLYTHVDAMIRAGGDLFLTQDVKTFYVADTATQVALLRKSTKNILYTVVNSNAMSVKITGYKMAIWKEVLIIVDCAIVVALIAWGAVVITKTKRKASAS